MLENALPKKILIVDDEPDILDIISYNLKAEGYKVKTASSGREGVEKAKKVRPDLILLDVMMPEMDGFTLAGEIREIDKHVPILFLTAKSMKEDKLQGFTLGADDYLTKPFAMDELLARINAILRRTEGKTESEQAGELAVGKLKYEPEFRLIHLKEGVKKLTTKENQLLQLLVKNQNEILDRNATLRAIWGDDNYFNGRSMDVYIAKLRKYLKEDSTIEIVNIHGNGFRLVVQ